MVMEMEGEQWKDKARSLQLLLRHRFRVAVDRHRPCPPDASIIQLWIDRFRNFRRDSLPSSTKFYLKRGHCYIYIHSFYMYILYPLALAPLSLMSRVSLTCCLPPCDYSI